MKFLYVLCVLALTGAAIADLNADLVDFANLIPVEETNEIVNSHVEDEEFLNIIIYIYYSDEFKSLITEAERMPDFIEYLNFMEDSGLEIYRYINLLHEAIGMDPLIPARRNPMLDEVLRANLKQIRDEIRAILPQNDITYLHALKLDQSADFKKFADRYESQEMQAILTKLRNNVRYQEILLQLLSNGVDIADNILFYEEVFGFRLIEIRP